MWEALYENFWDRLVHYCARLTRDQTRAEDLAQETFLRAMQHAELLAGLNLRQQKAWLFETAHNLFCDQARRVARELTQDLPLSVRERAVAAVVKAQLWTRKQAEYSAVISERADGHCTVRCMINRLDERLFCLELGMPDRLTAELVKKQFILKGNEIYQLLINKLTEEGPTFSEKK